MGRWVSGLGVRVGGLLVVNQGDGHRPEWTARLSLRSEGFEHNLQQANRLRLGHAASNGVLCGVIFVRVLVYIWSEFWMVAVVRQRPCHTKQGLRHTKHAFNPACM